MTTRAERGTSPWWLDRLGAAIVNRRRVIGKFDEYYSGKQGRRILSSSKHRRLFEDMLGKYAENFCGIVVDAIAQRLEVQGFRFPTPDPKRAPRAPREKAEPADRDAWRIWQDNQLDAESQLAHVDALVKSVAYVLISPFESEYVAGRSPRIDVEDAYEAIVEYRSGSRERRIGMKQWWDDEEGALFATLFFPDRVEKWRADGRSTKDSIEARLTNGEPVIWRPREVDGETWPLPHNLGVVPLIELRNRPRLGRRVESEIAQVMAIQDAINTLAFNELVASDTAAFPQKWATGIEVPENDPTWNPDMARILSTVVHDARMGTFAAADLNQWGDAIDRRVKRIASITATPYHYFLDHGGQPPSGDSIKSGEAGLVRKAMGKHLYIGETWEEVIRLAFKALDDPRADILDSETIWAPAETLTEATHADALLKIFSTGVPAEQIWEEWGYSPQQIERFKTMAAEETLSTTPLPPLAEPPAMPVTRSFGRDAAGNPVIARSA